MSDLQIDNLGRLSWLLLALGAGGVMAYGFWMKRRALAAFAAVELHGLLAPGISRTRPYVKAALMLVAMTVIVAALIGPRWGVYFEDIQQRQLDVMVCLDVSKSMLAEDAGMSRLDRAKDDIHRLLDRVSGGTIGLVTFAGRPELACPLTDDFEYYRLALEDVGIHSAPRGGTDLGRAIKTAWKALGGNPTRDRAILLLTDGEDHGETAVDIAGQAADDGVIVFTIGIGDDQTGSLVPVTVDGQPTFVKHGNQQVWSKMDPAVLREIAHAGGGEYQPSGQVGDTQRTLEWIYTNKLAPKQRREGMEEQVERRHTRFHWFVALALALLTIETLVRERRTIRAASDGMD